MRTRAKRPRSFSPWRANSSRPASIALGDGLGRGLLGQEVVEGAAVPDGDVAAAVLARGDVALEGGVGQRVVLDLHRQPLLPPGRASAAWAPPSSSARRRPRGGSRSAGARRGAPARRRSASCGVGRAAGAARRSCGSRASPDIRPGPWECPRLHDPERDSPAGGIDDRIVQQVIFQASRGKRSGMAPPDSGWWTVGGFQPASAGLPRSGIRPGVDVGSGGRRPIRFPRPGSPMNRVPSGRGLGTPPPSTGVNAGPMTVRKPAEAGWKPRTDCHTETQQEPGDYTSGCVPRVPGSTTGTAAHSWRTLRFLGSFRE